LLGPSKITPEMVAPIATRFGWKVGRSPAVFVGISWKADTPPFTISHVQPRSPAGVAGVINGDTVKKIGDEEIRDYATFRGAILKYLSGDEAVMTLDRNGVKLELTLKLAALPENVNRPEK
jgi:S1-C subfamily serine protease